MWEYINASLLSFSHCFTREAAFKWFAIIVIGFMTWREHTGVTSFIRELCLSPVRYESLLHFFRSSSWELSRLQSQWLKLIGSTDKLIRENGMPILIGDGTKEGKEGKKMPCVKKLHQDSEDSSKASYIFGHMFGALGVLAGTAEKMFCVPLTVTLHDGNEQIRKWLNDETSAESHVVRMIREACKTAKSFIPSILLLDRYFLTVPALRALAQEEKAAGCSLLTIITKAKRNAVAYEQPVRKPGRGAPPKKGASVKLLPLFTDCAGQFTNAAVKVYGKQEQISYLCRDYLWGLKLYQELRFVLVNWFGTQSILVCTNLTFTPEQIIRLYGYRFKIECCFRELKQVLSGFSYHFWSKHMPKLNKYAKAGTDPLDKITEEKDKTWITAAYKATQGFVMTACIAMGLLQLGALYFHNEIRMSSMRWLRTESNSIPSEATTADFMRKSIFSMLHNRLDLKVIRFIRDEQQIGVVDSGKSDA